MRSGSLDGAVITTAATAPAVPQLGVFDLPFLVSDYKEIDALLDGSLGDRLAGFYGAAGLVHLSFWEQPINKLEDLQGLKLRVIRQNKTFIGFEGDSGDQQGTARKTRWPFCRPPSCMRCRSTCP